MPSKPRVYAALYLAMIALANVVWLAAMPPYRIWVVGTLAALLLAMYGLSHRQTRLLLGGAYVLLAVISTAIGALYWDGSNVRNDGLVMLLGTLPILAFTLIRIAVVELDEA